MTKRGLQRRIFKGQVWSLDFIVSVIVFLSVLIPLFFVWNQINLQNQQELLFEDIERMALSLSDSLVRTGGFPEDWNESTVSVIGLASGDNILDESKVSSFLSMGAANYNMTRTLLTGSYDFFFEITDINGTAIGSMGQKPDDKMIVPIERYCIYNGRIVRMELALIS